MSCTCPQTYYVRDPAHFNGAQGLTKDPRKALSGRTIVVPCGACIDCRLDRSREWSLRVMHELQTSPGGAIFATLTYDGSSVPLDYGLHYRDFQLFMHKLRKRVPSSGRFFMSGEYGDSYGRPHFHAVLFNCILDDVKPLRKSSDGSALYSSELLSEIWSHGFVSLGAVTLHSAGYVARYALKKITGPAAGDIYNWRDPETGEIFEREPPFSHSSLKPGIGYDWFMRYVDDVFPCDFIVFEGKKFRVPRYYLKLYERLDELKADQVKRERAKHARASRDRPDNSSRRLRDRWEVHVLNSKNQKRNSGL